MENHSISWFLHSMSLYPGFPSEFFIGTHYDRALLLVLQIPTGHHWEINSISHVLFLSAENESGIQLILITNFLIVSYMRCMIIHNVFRFTQWKSDDISNDRCSLFRTGLMTTHILYLGFCGMVEDQKIWARQSNCWTLDYCHGKIVAAQSTRVYF